MQGDDRSLVFHPRAGRFDRNLADDGLDFIQDAVSLLVENLCPVAFPTMKPQIADTRNADALAHVLPPAAANDAHTNSRIAAQRLDRTTHRCTQANALRARLQRSQGSVEIEKQCHAGRASDPRGYAAPAGEEMARRSMHHAW